MGDTLLTNEMRQRITTALACGQDESSAGRQSRRNFRGRCVETERCELQDVVPRCNSEPIDMCRCKIGDAAVGDGDAFWRTCGARCVDDVGGVLRCEAGDRCSRG